MDSNVHINVASVLSDLNSKDINQGFCDFVKECLFSTLTKPVRIHDFKNLNVDKLIDLKRKADLQIREELKTKLNLDLDVSKITSVFESPIFYDDILSKLTKCNRTLAEENFKSVYNNKTVLDSGQVTTSTCSDKLTVSGLPIIKVYDKECSFKYGHVDLDMSAIEKSGIQFSNNVKLLLRKKCDCPQETENLNLMKPIFAPPITQSKFKLINVNFYLALSQFCGCCQKRLKDKSILNSLCKEHDSLKSSIKFNNEISLFRPFPREKLLTEKINCDATNLKLDYKSENCVNADANISSVETGNEITDVISNPDSPVNENFGTDNITSVENEIKNSTNISKLNERNLEYSISPFKSALDISQNQNSYKKSPVLDVIPTSKVSKRNFENTSNLTTKQFLNKFSSKRSEHLESDLLAKETASSANKSPLADINVERLQSPFEYILEEELSSDVAQNKNIGDKVPLSKTIGDNSNLTSKQILNEIYSKYNETLQKSSSLSKNNMVSLKENNVKKEETSLRISSSKNKAQRSVTLGDKTTLVLSSNLINTSSFDNPGSTSLIDRVPLVSLEGNNDIVREASDSKTEALLNDIYRKSARQLARKLKREKRKKKKLLRAKIDLAPPPGVDLDEFLMQQVASIKLSLQHLGDEEQSEKCSLDIPDLIKDQVEKPSLLGEESLLDSAGIHVNPEVKVRKVYNCNYLDQDFEALPEFNTTSQQKAYTSPIIKRKADWNSTQCNRSANHMKKSVVNNWRNRSRTPLISRNRLRNLKQSAPVKSGLHKSKVGESEYPKTSASKIDTKTGPLPIIISDDEISDGETSPSNAEHGVSSFSGKSAYSTNQLPRAYRDERFATNSPILPEKPYKKRTSRSPITENSTVKNLNSSSQLEDKSSEIHMRKSRYNYNDKKLSPRERRSPSRSPRRNRRYSPHRRRSNSISYKRKSSPRRYYRSKSPRYRNKRSRSKSPRRPRSKKSRHESRSPASKGYVNDSSNIDEDLLLNIRKAVSPPPVTHKNAS